MALLRFPMLTAERLKPLVIKTVLLFGPACFAYYVQSRQLKLSESDFHPHLKNEVPTTELDMTVLAFRKYEKVFSESLRELGPFDYSSREERLKMMKQAEKMTAEKMASGDGN